MDECGNVQLLDVQSINQRIQVLNNRLQQPVVDIYEPRENAFIALDLDLTEIKNVVHNAIGKIGRIRTTTTCPGHCTLDVPKLNGKFLILCELNLMGICVQQMCIIKCFLGEHLVVPRLVDTLLATLTAIDYDGKLRTLGGDPVTVTLTGPLDEGTQQERIASSFDHQRDINSSSDSVCVIDHKNGQYMIRSRLPHCGRYSKKIENKI